MVMKKILVCFVLLLAGFGGPQLLRAQTPAMPDDKQAAQPRKRSGIFTLYALDPWPVTSVLVTGKKGWRLSTISGKTVAAI